MRFAGRQDTVGQELMWLACRCQVMELILAQIFTLYGDPMIHIIHHLLQSSRDLKLLKPWGGET